jgi:hypothetical protein
MKVFRVKYQPKEKTELMYKILFIFLKQKKHLNEKNIYQILFKLVITLKILKR